MKIFRFSQDWADLVVAQLATSHQTRRTEAWGYACLVIGREFEGVIERNWHAVDRLTGPYFHVFALLPPPKHFVLERLMQLRQLPRSADTEFARQKFESVLQLIDFDRTKLVREKVELLTALRGAGLRPDQYADFLFFSFRNDGTDVDINVVAAKHAGIPKDSDDRDYLACIDRMTRVAEKHYHAKSPVEEVVKDMTLGWDVKVAIQRASGLGDYIKDFVKRITVGG